MRGREHKYPKIAECQILDQAILSKVLMQQAEKDSLPITDEEVDADLELRVREFVRMYGTEKKRGRTCR